MHFIRKHILRTLTLKKWARFRDMKPGSVDSNLYNYHLKELIKDGYVERREQKGYRLSPAGLRYVDHVSLESFEPRWQPKLLTKLYIQNEEGAVLMWPKMKQPFIGTWSLPSGKIHYDDVTTERAAQRELSYITDKQLDLRLLGVAEIAVHINNNLTTHGIEYVYGLTMKAADMQHEYGQWVQLSELPGLRCAPGSSAVLELVASGEFFCSSLRVDW